MHGARSYYLLLTTYYLLPTTHYLLLANASAGPAPLEWVACSRRTRSSRSSTCITSYTYTRSSSTGSLTQRIILRRSGATYRGIYADLLTLVAFTHQGFYLLLTTYYLLLTTYYLLLTTYYLLLTTYHLPITTYYLLTRFSTEGCSAWRILFTTPRYLPLTTYH